MRPSNIRILSMIYLRTTDRQLVTRRHLRRVYVEPLTFKPEWGIIRAPDGGIMGLISLSTGRSMKSRNFLQRDSGLEKMENYSDWRFVYESSNMGAFNGDKRLK